MEKNIRSLSGFENRSYYEINREERNLCAILYHTLLTGDNLEKFLDKIKCNFERKKPEIYLEYAFIRDIWSNIKKEKGLKDGNELKRNIILEVLELSNSNELRNLDIQDFNKIFVSRENPSENEIESPSNWNIKQISENYKDNEDFINICKFKWSFNAKPDMVIHTSSNQAICVECKLESGEGSYPSDSEEKKIFNERGLERVKQLEIQKLIMEILGIEAKPCFITKKKSENGYTWKEIFKMLDVSNCHPSIQTWLKENETINNK